MKCMWSEKSRAKKMARFHQLVDLSLQGNLGQAEEAELATLRNQLDRRGASAAAKLQRQMAKEQVRFDKTIARIRTQVAALRVDPANAANRPKSKAATAS